LEFDELPPGLNGKTGLLRMHWTVRRQLMQRWLVLVRRALEDSPVTHFDREHPCTIIAVRRSKRLMDWDNFGASLKPVLDGLVKTGVLSDDSPKVVRALTLRQLKSPSKQTGSLSVFITPYVEEPKEGDP
jgi:hypothetical protein